MKNWNKYMILIGAAMSLSLPKQEIDQVENLYPSFLNEEVWDVLQEKHDGRTYYKLREPWNKDGMLYDSLLSQVKPYPLSGIVWYQGESDTTSAEAAVYTDELRLMIDIWRRDFGNPLLPFVVVQIADYDFPYDKDAWRALQAAQDALSGSMKNVSVVKSSDVCEHDDIHPKTKDKLANRIAAILDGHIG